MINQVINEDCRELMNRMVEGAIDLIVTDPPYRLVTGGTTSLTTKPLGGALSKNVVKDGKIFDYNDIDFKDWIPSAYRVLKDKGHFYCFINHNHLNEVVNVAQNAGFILNNILVMIKDNSVVNCWYMKNVEYILFFRKGGMNPLNNNSDNTATMVRMPKEIDKIHPTQKPIKYLEMLIKNSSKPGELVYDPFSGSGSTLIASLNAGRNYIGSEIDPEFYRKSKKRLKELEDFLNGQLLAF